MTDEKLEGRELDAAVAQRVFGKRVRKVRYLEGYSWPKGGFLKDDQRVTHFEECLAQEMEDGEILAFAYDAEPVVKVNLVPHYADKIEDAWRVVSHLRDNWRFLFQETPGKQWRAVFSSHHFHDVAFMEDDESAPTAIARAGLHAAAWIPNRTNPGGGTDR